MNKAGCFCPPIHFTLHICTIYICMLFSTKSLLNTSKKEKEPNICIWVIGSQYERQKRPCIWLGYLKGNIRNIMNVQDTPNTKEHINTATKIYFGNIRRMQLSSTLQIRTVKVFCRRWPEGHPSTLNGMFLFEGLRTSVTCDLCTWIKLHTGIQ